MLILKKLKQQKRVFILLQDLLLKQIILSFLLAPVIMLLLKYRLKTC